MIFFFSSRRRHTRCSRDWSSDVCSSDLIVLSRQLGAAGHYPAIDVLQSGSRLAPRLCSPEQKNAAVKIREAMATHQRSEEGRGREEGRTRGAAHHLKKKEEEKDRQRADV